MYFSAVHCLGLQFSIRWESLLSIPYVSRLVVSATVVIRSLCWQISFIWHSIFFVVSVSSLVLVGILCYLLFMLAV